MTEQQELNIDLSDTVPAEQSTQIVTFYSYKGGVGRTMAAANAAAQLANKHGLDVILVDWDLEAPGLHYYFGYTDKELQKQDGLLDYLEMFIEQVKRGAEGKVLDIESFLIPPKKEIGEKIKFGSVRLLTCGRTDDRYMHRVRAFNWDSFYEIFEGFQIIETLKSQLRRLSEIALIDARSGQSEIGATPTIQVPDAVLLLFTSNRQSLEGTARIARFLKNHPSRTRQGFSDLRLLLVPSRVFKTAEKYSGWIDKEAAEVFSRLVEEGIVDRDDQPEGLKQCALTVDPHATVGESLPALDDIEGSELYRAYDELAAAIADLRAGRDLWSKGPPKEYLNDARLDNFEAGLRTWRSAVPFSRTDDLAKQLTSAEIRNDDNQRARLQYQLGVKEAERGNYQAAELLLAEAMGYYRGKGETTRVFACKLWLAHTEDLQGNHDNASDMLENLISEAHSIQNKNFEARGIEELARVKRSRGSMRESIALLKTGISLARELNDVTLEAALGHSLGHAHESIGELKEARIAFTAALDLTTDNPRTRGSSELQLENLYCLADILRELKSLPDAVAVANRGIRLAERWKRQIWLAKFHYTLGKTLAEQRQFATAIEAFNFAVELCTKKGDAEGEIINLQELANVALAQGRDNAAIEFLMKAGDVARRESLVLKQIDTLLELAKIHLSFKRIEQGTAVLANAAEVADRLPNQRMIANTLRAIADSASPYGQYELARAYFNRAIVLAEKISDPQLLARFWHGLGHLEERAKNPDDAMAAFQKSLDIAIKQGDHMREAENYGCMASLLIQKRDLDKAFEMASKGFELAKINGPRVYAMNDLSKMSNIRRQQKRYSEALAYAKDGLAAAKEAEDRNDEASFIHLAALAQRHMGENLEAIEYLEKEVRLLEELGEPGRLAYAWLELALNAKVLNKPEEVSVYSSKAAAAARKSGKKKVLDVLEAELNKPSSD